ncbi:MAG: YihY family inner membrane protein [Proteobacteria bacterium]|nr:YihY family inner membrane protein [Pseudomonadota bacterium]
MKTFREKKIPVLAQSLAYTTIFAFVPILVIFFAVLGKITENTAVKLQFRELISVYILPEYVGSVFSTLESLSTDSLAFGAIGLPTLFVMGVFLYAKVNSSINEIWMSNKENRWFKTGLAFFMTSFFGPMILVLLFSIPPSLHNLPFYNEVIRRMHIDALITQLFPFLVLFVGLFVLYYYIPATTVKYGAAARGAFVAAVIIQISNLLVGIYLKSFSQIDILYGSLATIPIFLLWVYIFWVVVLTGAALTFIYQHHRETGYLNLRGMYNDESLLCSALQILVYLSQCFEKRNEAPDFDQIQLMLGLNRKRLSFVLETLIQEKFVIHFEEATDKRINTVRYQPGQSPANIHLKDLIPIFYHPRDHVVFQQSLNKILQTLDVHPGFHNDNITLLDFIVDPDNIFEDARISASNPNTEQQGIGQESE